MSLVIKLGLINLLLLTVCVYSFAADNQTISDSETISNQNKPSDDQIERDEDLTTESLTGVSITILDQSINSSAGYTNPVNTNVIPTTSTIQNNVFGQSPFVGLQPKRYKYNEISIIPTLGVGTGYNDNLGLRNKDGASSLLYYLNPSINSYIQKGGHKFSLIYDGHFYRYPNSTLDDRQINTIALRGENGFTLRSNLAWSIGYTDGAEERGLRDDSRTAVDLGPNKFKNKAANIKFQYGAKNARGILIAYAGFSDKEYTNNRDITESADYTSANLGTTFNYRLAPKTYLTADVNRTKTDYKLMDSLLNNTNDQYSVGIKWRARAKTNFEFKAGVQNKAFENSLVGDDQKTGFYRLTTTWSPRTYSKLQFYSSKENAAGTSILINNGNTEINVFNWEHQWNNSLISNLTLSHINTDFQGIEPREDTSKALDLSVLYSLKTSVGIELRLNKTDRESTNDNFSYDINTLSLTAHLSQ